MIPEICKQIIGSQYPDILSSYLEYSDVLSLDKEGNILESLIKKQSKKSDEPIGNILTINEISSILSELPMENKEKEIIESPSVYLLIKVFFNNEKITSDNFDLSILSKRPRGDVYCYRFSDSQCVCVSRTFGYSIEKSGLFFREENGYCCVMNRSRSDAHKKAVEMHRFEKKNVQLFVGFDSTLITVSWFLGKLWIGTHKKIDGKSSFFRTQSRKIEIMYDEYGGPTAEQLFDTSKDFADLCHIYVLIDPCNQVASRTTQVGIMYLGSLPTSSFDSNIGSKVPTEYFSKPKVDCIQSFQHEINVDEANHVLKYGYKESISNVSSIQRNGGFVFAKLQTNNGIMIYKVLSPSYILRRNIRGNYPNPIVSYFKLVHNAYYMSPDEYMRYYVVFEPKTKEEIYSIFEQTKKLPEFTQVYQNFIKYLRTPEDRMYQSWVYFLHICPCSDIELTLGYLDQYLSSKEVIKKWIIEIIQFSEPPRTSKVFLQKMVSYIRTTLNNIKNMLLNERIIEDFVTEIFDKYPGDKIYTLYKESIRFFNEKSKNVCNDE